MTAEMGLKAHQKKTTYVIIGTKKYREKMEKEAEADPIYFGKFICQPSVSEIYLGEDIHSEGLETGTEATINHRLGKVRGAMYKAKALIEDFRLQAITGMEGAWIIWERSIIPTLLLGCGSWIGIGKKIYEMIYSCPLFTPKPSLRSQAGKLDFKHRIWIEKVCVLAEILHNKKDQEENYAREVLREQLDQGWQGLITEVAEICQQVGLPNACHKYVYRKELVEAI